MYLVTRQKYTFVTSWVIAHNAIKVKVSCLACSKPTGNGNFEIVTATGSLEQLDTFEVNQFWAQERKWVH